jgi:hypothetical protein
MDTDRFFGYWTAFRIRIRFLDFGWFSGYWMFYGYWIFFLRISDQGFGFLDIGCFGFVAFNSTKMRRKCAPAKDLEHVVRSFITKLIER